METPYFLFVIPKFVPRSPTNFPPRRELAETVAALQQRRLLDGSEGVHPDHQSARAARSAAWRRHGVTVDGKSCTRVTVSITIQHLKEWDYNGMFAIYQLAVPSIKMARFQGKHMELPASNTTKYTRIEGWLKDEMGCPWMSHVSCFQNSGKRPAAGPWAASPWGPRTLARSRWHAARHGAQRRESGRHHLQRRDHGAVQEQKVERGREPRGPGAWVGSQSCWV